LRKPYRVNLFSALAIIFSAVITACSSSKGGAVQAIEAYIQALSNQDSTQLSNLSCSSWEAEALVELDSLAGVGSKVVDLTCQQAGQEGSDTYVSCKGSIALDYNGEAQQIDLSNRTYIAHQEDGVWLMCGYR
jgi:hypothetical protein